MANNPETEPDRDGSIDAAATERLVADINILMEGEMLNWSSANLDALAAAMQTGQSIVKIIRLNRDDLLLRCSGVHDPLDFAPLLKPEEVMNHRAVAGSKRGRQLINIRGHYTKAHEDTQGEKQLERGKKYYMVPSSTNGLPIVQTRSRKELDLEV